MNLDFVSEWTTAVGRVEALVSRQLGDRNDVDDVVQQTAIRAQRGYAAFQRRSSFLTWVLRIARNEAIRLAARKRVHQPLTAVSEPIAPPAVSEAVRTGPADWPGAIAGAAEDGFLTNQQADILRGRLACDEASWDELAAKLDLKPNHCAVLYHRAIKNLRVYLFVARPHFLGDPAQIEQAFALARADRLDALTAAEEAAFRRAILERSAAVTGRGLLGPLRSACGKIALRLRRD